MWNKYTQNGTMKVTISSVIYKIIYHEDSYFCYLERESDKDFRFYMKNSSYFEMSASLY